MEVNPQLSLKDLMMEETFSKRWGSRTWPCEGLETWATTRKVVRSKRTTSSADSNSAKDFKCASMTSVFNISDCTMDDHACEYQLRRIGGTHFVESFIPDGGAQDDNVIEHVRYLT